MTGVTNVGGISMQPVDIKGMDLETALMAVQSNRANVLESQLKDQIAAVQAKNDQIARMNSALSQLTKIQAKLPSDMKPTDKINDTIKGNDYQVEKETNTALEAAGVRPFGQDNGDWSGRGRTLAWNASTNSSSENSPSDSPQKDIGTAAVYDGGLGGNTTKGQLDGAISSLKSQIDSLSNTQQMDMLRLQSLSNKRNEAYDIMTNFMKKNADNRGSIVGNMR